MKKIETIWHYLLFEAIEKGQFRHTQAEIAEKTGFSLSTVNHAIEIPGKIGAIRKETKFFVVSDVMKFLYFWGSVRDFHRDIIYQTFVDAPILEIEGLMPPGAIFGGYSAARQILKEPPADYDKAYCYLLPENVKMAEQRFPKNKSRPPNFFVVAATREMFNFGVVTTLPQTFVDIWNLPDWFSHDFTISLEKKINGLLS